MVKGGGRTSAGGQRTKIGKPSFNLFIRMPVEETSSDQTEARVHPSCTNVIVAMVLLLLLLLLVSLFLVHFILHGHVLYS